MKDRLVGFVEALRAAGLRPGPSESIDAVRAVAVAGVERPVFRECLAATLVKEHADRLLFDDVFDRYFAVPGRERRGAKKPPPLAADEGGSGGGDGSGHIEGPRDQRLDRLHERERGRKLARHRSLRELPFRDMSALQVEESRELAEELARRFRVRWSRRLRRARRGRLDMRRTIRRSMSRGGVALELLFRKPRPGKTNLVALVDVSFSTAVAADFLLALLAPSRGFFRRVTLFAYVDTMVEFSYEGGQVVPHDRIDVNARSDFGKVLSRFLDQHGGRLDRNTVVLILGDARNNRLPPRADVLARLRQKARLVLWLNPESPERWDTGDSVMRAYARHVDMLLAAHNLATLETALNGLATRIS